MKCGVIDLTQLAKERLAQASQQHPLIAVYIDHRYVVAGELAQRLKIPLADILLAQATSEKMDILILVCTDDTEARAVFARIPRDWKVDDHVIPVQLWSQGQLQTEAR